MASSAYVDHSDEVQRQLLKKLKANGERVGLMLVKDVKKSLNKAAPYKVSKKTGNRYVPMSTDKQKLKNRATPGAAPRKVSSTLQKSIDHKVNRSKRGVSVLIGTNVDYARPLELGNPKGSNKHPFLRPAIVRKRKKIIETLARGLF